MDAMKRDSRRRSPNDIDATDSSQLLSVALTVDQLDGGEFHWLILESFDHSMEFEQLAASVIGFDTYAEALEAGFEVLKGMSLDPRVGPRDADESGNG